MVFAIFTIYQTFPYEGDIYQFFISKMNEEINAGIRTVADF